MKGEGIIGAADTVTKAYIRKNEVFADAFNYFMYDGRQKIQPEQLRELDSTEIAILLNEKDTKDKTNKEKEASEQKMVQKYRDLLKTATIMEDGEATYVLLGIENQTEVHYAMPVRNMLYDAMQYNQQVTEIAEKHKGKKGGKRQQKISTGEFLSGFYKNNKLIPVITLVLFFNPGEWDGPRSLFDMLDISNPIFKLNESVKAYETGKTKDIYIGGFSEIRHLGYSVKKSYEQIEVLMEEIIRQQNEKRKSEMDALQSQINPHFLYNTLESITWMVEANKNEEAVFMISELAKLLRISLSKGRTVIRIADELQHSTSYMNIQKVRYKDRFETEFLIEEEIKEYCTIKLIIQPILENAIYYGVGNMDEDDGGKITVKGKKDGNDIYISVIDNGMGMSEEIVENLLLDNGKVPKHGSGVGLINVHTRIQLMHGKEYGLKIYSEPDEGTEVVIHIPAIPFSEENRKKLEEQTYRKGEAYDEKK